EQGVVPVDRTGELPADASLHRHGSRRAVARDGRLEVSAHAAIRRLEIPGDLRPDLLERRRRGRVAAVGLVVRLEGAFPGARDVRARRAGRRPRDGAGGVVTAGYRESEDRESGDREEGEEPLFPSHESLLKGLTPNINGACAANLSSLFS